MKILLSNNVKILDIPLGISLKWSRWNDITAINEDESVIFNTLNRTAMLISNTEYHDLSLTRKNIDLYALGMLVDSTTDEQQLLEQRYILGKKDMSYIDLTILLTKNCQFKCLYCFEGPKQNVFLSEAASNNILIFLQQYIGVCKKLRVTWFGGEPLLGYSQMRDLSHRLIDFCTKNQIEYIADITTNGFALNEQRCDELINNLHVKRFIVTIDGPAVIHDQRRLLQSGAGTFSRIWDNLEILVNKGAHVTLRMTIDRFNADYIPQLLDDIVQSKIANKVWLTFCRTIDYGFTSEKVKDSLYTDEEFADIEWGLIKYAHQLGLMRYSFPYAAPIGGCLRDGDIVIGTDGEIYKCLDTIGDEKWITGHIAQAYGMAIAEWYKAWLEWTPSQSIACRECTLQPLCNGGCPHNALFREKKHGTDAQCPDWKANYKRQIKEFVKEL